MSWNIPKREASQEIIEGLNQVSLGEVDKALQSASEMKTSGDICSGKHSLRYYAILLLLCQDSEKHTQIEQRTWNNYLHYPRDFVWSRRWKTTNQEQTISADCFPNLRRGLNLPRLPSTEVHPGSWLACHFSWNCCPASLTPTISSAPLCRNPALRSHKDPGKGHRQAAAPVHRSHAQPHRSLPWEGISRAHPLVLPEELLQETLNEPTLTSSMCWNLKWTAEVAGSLTVTQQLRSSQVINA